jgi:hypothetical protein
LVDRGLAVVKVSNSGFEGFWLGIAMAIALELSPDLLLVFNLGVGLPTSVFEMGKSLLALLDSVNVALGGSGLGSAELFAPAGAGRRGEGVAKLVDHNENAGCKLRI